MNLVKEIIVGAGVAGNCLLSTDSADLVNDGYCFVDQTFDA